ncbi:hypothetical protein ETAA8_28590 [Anatilimnocola aggregata]|uniref:Uncharacterized protein n=1 Tax=Anatilimnocola aggregata TaxID=2528021 RepID=A0A517YBZ6_9BACT|nr:hypothetical protein [Anatilimnocola aggregata]QDU27768.1 hypothetical protein ETAA8_28590 [Anatilimnocola aggregata]
MTLKSDLFKKSQQLKDCEVKDSAHIVADEPPKRRGVNNKGPHVPLIHKALRKVMSNPKFGLEEPDEVYGPLTAEVVRQFKLGPPMILNKALGQTTPDNIIGKLTIKELDRQVALLEGKELPDLPIVPLDPDARRFTVVPFTSLGPFMISEQKHNPGEDDLDSTPRQPRNVPMTQALKDKMALARASLTFAEASMKLEIRGAAGALGEDMANRFFKNGAVQEMPFGPNDLLTQAVAKSPTFLACHKEVQDLITETLKERIVKEHVCDYHDLDVVRHRIVPDLPNWPAFPPSELALKAVIGGTKGLEVYLTNFTASDDPPRWQSKLKYVLYDHFGINDSDLILNSTLHGTQGQVSMWVMQHEKRPGHFPFITKITLFLDGSGDLS